MDPITEQNRKEYDTRANDWEAAMPGNLGHKYLEKPAMVSLLPTSLSGQSVLCIGVGAGEELEELLERHPTKITGIDISAGLLKIAKSKFPDVELLKMDMTELDLPEASFDLVYSSLAFHYAKDWDILLSGVAQVLKEGGTLVFSTHNPAYWRMKSATGNSYKNPRGVITDEYTAIIAGDVPITYYCHRDAQEILDAVKHAGFEVKEAFTAKVIEVDVPPNEKEAYEKLKEKNSNPPLFLIVKAIKI